MIFELYKAIRISCMMKEFFTLRLNPAFTQLKQLKPLTDDIAILFQ